jgi:elongator complex protein 3
MRTPFRKSHGKVTFVLYNKPYSCRGECLFCFKSKGFTKSTTSNEDTLLAKKTSWSGSKQLEARFKNYSLKKDSGIKCDFAVKGDSFASHSEDYLRNYTKELYDFLNGSESKTLKEASLLQRNSKDKCVTFKIETRPDQINFKKCLFFMELGITTVEIGVQSLDDNVLKYNHRGHTTKEVINVTKLLRKFGFEVVYQMMVGLPGSNRKIEKEIYTKTLWEDNFSPDAIKIYPCLLLKQQYVNHENLRDLYLKGIWTPIDYDDYLSFLFEISSYIPRYVHINRIQRIISEEKIEAGIKREIDRKIFSSSINCLWQRSVVNKLDKIDIFYSNYKIKHYLQGENRYCFEVTWQDDIVIGYARIDLAGNNSSIIRDIRVLGNMLLVGEKNKNKDCQHSGIGSVLLKTIETFALQKNVKYIYLKPSFGTSTWFFDRGFIYLGDFFMVKYLF